MPDSGAIKPAFDVIIAGAGIGGLSCALCLAKLDFTVLVLEKTQAPGEAGAGIQLGPNAFRILQHLGLANELSELACFPENLSIYDSTTGKPLARMPLGTTIERRHGAPYAIIHRADLHTVLHDQAENSPSITLKYSANLAQFDDDNQFVSVQTTNGDTYYARLLVGADGLWSSTRDKVLADGPPRYTGQMAWRATVRRDDLDDRFQKMETGLFLGANAHLVHYPIASGKLLNIVAIVASARAPEGWSSPGHYENLGLKFDGWHPQVINLLEHVAGWRTWALHDRDPAPEWGVGRVTLLGDAAHPMLPFLAQGGAMAIEDAWVLATTLKGNLDEPRAALRLYEKRRRARTARVSKASRANAKMFHLTGTQRTLRNMALKASRATPSLLLKRYDWLYGHNVIEE